MNLCGFNVGHDQPFFLIAGPCVLETESLVLDTAATLKDITDRLNIPFIFKASFDKANRSSHTSYRGPGIEKGLKMLQKVKDVVQVPVITDVHEVAGLAEIASVVDVLQTPALLCRQTNFIQQVAACGRPVNLKKGQFLAPEDMQYVVEKAKAMGNEHIMITERGFSFGYNNLVSDMRGLSIMRPYAPLIFDATHSVQLPGGGLVSSGQRQFVAVLARAAIASGVSGLFMETHPNPEKALSDGPNSFYLHQMEALLSTLKKLDETVKTHGFIEDENPKTT
jgi:2-dehydro-3-deoxyphosphooctonate aldolase (KDO 8-P synthase)